MFDKRAFIQLALRSMRCHANRYNAYSAKIYYSLQRLLSRGSSNRPERPQRSFSEPAGVEEGGNPQLP
jgi:hypothetical protein